MGTNWYDESTLPKYAKPPVIEIAMALEFAPVERMDAVQLVRLQDRWAGQYPVLREVPGAPPTPLDGAPGEVMMHFGDAPRRIWAEDPSSGTLLQTQSDRLILNWRSHDGTAIYPGYRVLRQRFGAAWEEMRRFVASLQSEALPHSAEFTYVNRVPMAASEHIADVVNLVGRPEHELPGSERYGRFQFMRELSADADNPFPVRVTIDGQPQGTGDQRALVFTIVSRALPVGSDPASLSALDAAHALASHTFSRIVATPKQDAWGREK